MVAPYDFYILSLNSENRGSTNPAFHSFGSERHVKDLISSTEFKEDDKKGIDVVMYHSLS